MSQVLQEQALLAKLRDLPPDRIGEVEGFVDFFRQRDEDRRLTQSVAKLSEVAFEAVWDNDEDAVYDDL